MQSAIFLAGHGSRSAKAGREFETAVHDLRKAVAVPVEYGYLEFATPTIGDALGQLAAQGAKHIRVIPGMLFAAGHVKNDVPSVINTFAQQHPDVTLTLGKPCGFEPALMRLAGLRIEQAMAAADAEHGAVSADETLLLTIGRGTSDPDANGNIAKIGRMLTEGKGFAHGEIGFSGVAHPRVGAATERAIAVAKALGLKRIMVAPYFLFDGILVQRIYTEFLAKGAEGATGMQHVTANYLGNHPLLVEGMLAIDAGIAAGDTAMNCQLCKYRTQILGFEDAVGTPQVGHHHGVEGVGVEENPVDHGHWSPEDGHHHHGDGHHHHH